ncbi:type I polyketide synthase [Aspergillus vadensis CBS 113365]|uniref:Ketoacyl-synt-domain-containing protein n=1 Tax=Aspergillus vadensis (strain CBS 113365 / IMI 142717 / IBT 24658) TaxID=1448311 RepID=A0A319BU67_ASPVC|nr:ketoacyl-synt-domain-containing protein [Aspergillus vadensis CBS 113365]PYH66658.1 ketoacyl-synt-domain-containing protein [Aspergillus vadensis CBS 113365]
MQSPDNETVPGLPVAPATARQTGLPIAVVGIGCRLPGNISSPAQLWDFLREGRSAAGEVPKDRFNIFGYRGGKDEPGTTLPLGGYFLQDDIRNFDNRFFGINNREAAVMDPQQRRVLEVVFETFESAGVTLDEVSGANVGVYMASFTPDYIAMQTKDPENLTRYSNLGMGATILGNRISHAFNLKGPSCTVDTACSSSFYALHLACNALQNGECDSAIVAGVNLIQSPELHAAVSQGGFLSPTSFCHTFDTSADGYARADGVNSIFIKRLDDAIRNQDVIRSIIRGTAVNSNGRTPGVAQPSIDGQVAVICKAYARAGLDPAETAYVECHGTGTQVGDPMEVEALSRVFRKEQRTYATLIGSVKPNLGHGEASSGLSSLIKATLALEHGQIPATISVKNINPKIKTEEWGVDVVTRITPFPVSTRRVPSRISVNSFGYGGANAHGIIEEPDHRQNQVSIRDGGTSAESFKQFRSSQLPYLLPFSANCPQSLEGRVERLSKSDLSCVSVSDLAYTLGQRRSLFACRGYVIARQDTLTQDITVANLQLPTSNLELGSRKIAFVFTGQGAQWQGMARQLLHYPTFANTIRQLDDELRSLSRAPDWRIYDVLMDESDSCPIDQAVFAQPITTAVQIGLVALLRSWSILAEGAIGHSSGEIGAAYVAGLLSAREAIVLAYYRGYAVTRQASAAGAMAAVGLSSDMALEMITKLDLTDSVKMACINSSSSVTISGDRGGVDTLVTAVQAKGSFARILNTDGKAYHSHHMVSVGELYQNLLDEAAIFAKEMIPETESSPKMYSTAICKPLERQTARTTWYWRFNLESPVRFSEGLKGLSELIDPDLWLEIGPHTALKLPITQTLGQLTPYHGTLERGQDGSVTLLSFLGYLFVHGFSLDFTKLLRSYPDGSLARFIYDLPTYAWHYEEPVWNESRTSRESRYRQNPRHELLGTEVPGGSPASFAWRNLLHLGHVPWLRDHRLGDTAVFPAAGYIAMAVEALIQKALPSGADLISKCVILRQVALLKALSLKDEDCIELFTELHPLSISNVRDSQHWWEFQIFTVLDRNTYTLHAKGMIRLDCNPDDTSHAAPSPDCRLAVRTKQVWYDIIARGGLKYGTAFQRIKEVYTPESKKILYAEAPTESFAPEIPTSAQSYPRYFLHPTLLDTVLQLALIACNGGSLDGLVARVPTLLGEVSMSLAPYAPDEAGIIRAKASVVGLKMHRATTYLFNQKKQPVVQFKDIEMTAFSANERMEDVRHLMGRVHWKPDITQISEDSVFSSGLAHVLSMTDLGAFGSRSWLLAALDMIVHKKPDSRILCLTTDLSFVTVACLEALETPVVYRRFETFSLGRIGSNGALEVAEIRKYAVPLGLRSMAYRKATSDDQYNVCILGQGSDHAVLGHLKKHTNDCTFFLGPCTQFSAPVPSSHLQLTDRDHGVYVLRPNPNFTPQFNHVVLIGASSSDAELASHLSKELDRPVQALTLRDILSSPIPPQTLVVSMIEMHKSLLSDPTAEEYDAFKELIEHAAHIFWISGSGVYNGFDPTRSIFTGLARALIVEQPSTRIFSLEIDPATETSVVFRYVRQILQQKNEVDFEYIRDGSQLLISRVVPDERLNREFRRRQNSIPIPKPLAQADNAYLLVPEPGQLNSAKFVQRPLSSTLPADHVLVKVVCVGLNAKDVYVMAGRVSTKNATCSSEFTGQIVGLGADVQSFAVGDRVAVMHNGHFGTYEPVPWWSCIRLEDNEDLVIMAGVLVVFFTAVYALEYRARLQPAESILIHSAAGAVGIATIQLARHLGVGEIYATVGNEEKKRYLVEQFGLRSENIFSSRDTTFVEKVKVQTRGRGIDVILNSLVGDLLHESWNCLADWGRFVEIGKRDILDCGKLNMTTFARGTTFTSFDLNMLNEPDTPIAARHLKGTILARVLQLVRAGHVRPVQPLAVFPVSELSAACNHFNNAKRMGKIVISFEDKTQIVPTVPELFSTALNPKKSYLMVGCLGGLGRSLSRWMMSRGARRFVFLGRTGLAKPAARQIVQELEEAGARCTVVTGDVIVYEDVERAVAAAVADAPLGGVIQAAMGLHEAIFKHMPRQHWLTGTQAKVRGTWNLHQALGKLKCESALDFFLLTSSVAGQIGTATEGNYCAANHFLDVFARYRRSLGLRAISLGLGAISEVGYLHEHSEIGELLLRKGIRPLPENEVLQVIDFALSSEIDQEKTVPRDRLAQCHILTGIEDTGLQDHRKQGFTGFWHNLDNTRFSVLINALQRQTSQSEGGINTPASVIQTVLASGDEKQLREAVVQAVAKKMSNIILLPLPKLDLKLPLSEYGMDSMLSAELRQYIFNSMGVDIPFLTLMDSATSVLSIAEIVVGELGKMMGKVAE